MRRHPREQVGELRTVVGAPLAIAVTPDDGRTVWIAARALARASGLAVAIPARDGA